MVIFALSGSLRKESSNTIILETLRGVLPEKTEFILFDKMASIPHYNPDLDTESPPAVVAELRGMIKRSSAIVISTPEYAHGIPGSLKNVLDWLVSTTITENKPVGLIFGSASDGSFAQKALIEVLDTMNAKVIHEAVVNIAGVQVKGTNESLNNELRDFLDNLISNSVLKS